MRTKLIVGLDLPNYRQNNRNKYYRHKKFFLYLFCILSFIVITE